MVKLFIVASLFILTTDLFAYELNVTCTNIMPENIEFENGGILTDTFNLSERLGYFDEGETSYGLIQSVKIVDSEGTIVTSLNVVSQFHSNGECGPSKIIADNKSRDALENNASVRITIEIKNVCDAENTSKYTLERKGKTPIVKSFTQCSYKRN